MADVTIDMIGLKELEEILLSMPDKFNYKFLTGAHKVALKPFIAEAKRRAPVGTKRVISKKYASRTHDPGNLRDSIKVGLAPKSRKLAGVWAGPTSEDFKGKKSKNAYYAHMVEFGHFIKKREGGHSGRAIINQRVKARAAEEGHDVGEKWVKPHPFMRPAWDATNGQMKANMGKIYIDRMQRYIKKLAKNASR